MSKSVKRDHDFNIDKYTNLLRIAQGGRSQTDFANDCGLSVAYICKSLNQRINKAPIPSTLKKIAACAAGGVTYSDLLEAAGYDSSLFLSDSCSDLHLPAILDFNKLATAAVTVALSHCSFQWSSLVRSNVGVDFGITLIEEKISNWYFMFVHKSTFFAPDNALSNRLMMYYAKIVMTKYEPRTKLSFVTDSEQIFFDLTQLNPYMLSMYVSVILIDATSLGILKEEYLSSSLTLIPELESLYVLT